MTHSAPPLLPIDSRELTRVCVFGGTGMLGRALCDALTKNDVEVTVYSRKKPAGVASFALWDPARGEIDTRPLAEADAVVNLTGENIAEGRWTASRKQQLTDSRVGTTALIARTLAALVHKPRVWVNASAVGYYGHREDDAVNEQSDAGEGFLAQLCTAWEAATEPANACGVRVVRLRLGVVLTPEGGMLRKLLPVFRMGLGGTLGSGQQFMPWVTMHDAVNAVLFALRQTRISGPVNVVAPEPVTNAQFTELLAQRLGKPAFMPVPKLAIRTLFGELGDSLMLSGANVRPRVLEQAGFRFEYPRLEDALAALLPPKA
jgi:uncharacterized protein